MNEFLWHCQDVAGSRVKCLVSSLADIPLVSMQLAGFPKVPSPVVTEVSDPEVLPLELVLPCCVFFLNGKWMWM